MTTPELPAPAEDSPPLRLAELDLSPEVAAAARAAGLELATQLQAEAVPVLLAGGDALVRAPRGMGRTAAWGLPLAHSLDCQREELQALVLVADRGRALALCEDLAAWIPAPESGATLPVQPVHRQVAADLETRRLERAPRALVAEPARLLELVEAGRIELGGVTLAVLDGIDELERTHALAAAREVLDRIPDSAQVVLVGEAPSPAALTACEPYVEEPRELRGAPAPAPDEPLTVAPDGELASLSAQLEALAARPALVFARQARRAAELARRLALRGFATAALEGADPEALEDRLAELAAGRLDVLVACDAAAPRLAELELALVIGWDRPLDAAAAARRRAPVAAGGRCLEIRRERVPLGSADSPRSTAPQRDRDGDRHSTARDPGGRFGAERGDRGRADRGRFDRGGGDRDRDWNRRDRDRPWDRQQRGREGDRRPDDRRSSHGHGERAPAGAGSTEVASIFLAVGRMDNIRPGDVVGAIAGEADIPGKAIGAIKIFERHTLAEIPRDLLPRVLEAMNGATVRGRRITVREAHDEPPGRPRGGEGRPRFRRN